MKRRAAGSKSKIEVDGRTIALLHVSGKSPIDPAEFIPVPFPGARAADKVRVVRKGDLLSKSGGGAVAAAYVNFGDNLIDVFSPTYGSYYPLGPSAFALREAKAFLVHEQAWILGLEPRETGEQHVLFGVGPRGNYLKVELGQTVQAGIGAILTVEVGGSKFNLDLTSRSNLFFDLYLLSSGVHEVQFTLDSANNGLRNTICYIRRVELYDSIRVAQDPPVFA